MPSGTQPRRTCRRNRTRPTTLWAATGANRNDITELVPTLAEVRARGLLDGLEVLHLDRGYWARSTFALADRLGCQLDMPRPARRGQRPRKVALGVRWKVDRTNSWLSNFGQLRRSTDRHQAHRAAALDLAVALVVTIKLVDWARRWNHRWPALSAHAVSEDTNAGAPQRSDGLERGSTAPRWSAA